MKKKFILFSPRLLKSPDNSCLDQPEVQIMRVVAHDGNTKPAVSTPASRVKDLRFRVESQGGMSCQACF